MRHCHFASLTRLANLEGRNFSVQPVPRSEWRTGDYVVAQALAEGSRSYTVEWPNGRVGEMAAGDCLVGALGNRCATMELVGDWRDVGDDLQMHALTAAGVFGKCTSRAVTVLPPAPLRYEGHVVLDGKTAAMADFAPAPREVPFNLPVILVIGTSMECGKTTAAKALVRRLVLRGFSVAGVKLTGVGRYRDILGMRDAGADAILDFVDVGLPSSLIPADEFEGYVDRMLWSIAARSVDVVVAEVGASPMEPYNGEIAIQRLRRHVRLTILAATDLYAALGARDHLSVRPDLIVGRVASTAAGIVIVERTTGLPVVNPLDSASAVALDTLLTQAGFAARGV
jgi:hypothetical protein